MRVFISYSRTDAAAARALEAQLASLANVEVVLDRLIQGGAEWEDWIYRQIRLCDLVVFVLSPASADSHWCTVEIGASRSLDRPIIPIMVSSVDVPPALASLNAIDATQDLAAGVAELTQNLADRARLGNSLSMDLTVSPYPGLSGFSPEQGAYYFGRSREVADFVARLGDEEAGGIHVVAGSSGVGKSSFVRAGVLPRLQSEAAPWRSVELVTDGRRFDLLDSLGGDDERRTLSTLR